MIVKIIIIIFIIYIYLSPLVIDNNIKKGIMKITVTVILIFISIVVFIVVLIIILISSFQDIECFIEKNFSQISSRLATIKPALK